MYKKQAKPKGKFEFKLKFSIWNILLIVFTVVFLTPLVLTFLDNRIADSQVPISQALVDIKEQRVKKVEVQGDKILLTYSEDDVRFSTKEGGQSFAELLADSEIDPTSVDYLVSDQSLTRAFAEILSVVLPVLVMGGLLVFLFRSQAKGAQEIFSFGRSKAKLFAKWRQSVTFDDVAGVDEAKNELTEVVDFLKHPMKYKAMGARTPKGVLLFGPAGVGKTLLARAVAGEAGVPFFSMAGSEFMEMLVGVGAARVRDMFATAKKSAPSIIFIDEIESIGRQRGMGGFSGGHDEREQTLNQILVEMDGFSPNEAVIVIGATNRPDMLDVALIRPGRFDRRVTLGYPDLEERKAIISIHMRNKPFEKDVNMERIARRTIGFTGADLANMLNEAAILAAREDKKAIDNQDLEEAATKVKLGPQRKRLQSDEDRKLAAYHEAGHAVVGHYSPHVDPVHRVTIVARSMSGGHTSFPPPP